MASPWERAKAGASYSDLRSSMPKGQPGGMSSIPSSGKKDAFVNLQRQKFFGDRRDVPEERVFRRTAQDTGIELFKKQFTKPVNTIDPVTGKVTGTVTGLTQMTADAPRSLTEERIKLANKYGPTFGEVMGDVGYGLKNLFGGIAKIPGQLMQAYQQFSPMGNILSKVQEFGGKVFNPYDISGKLQVAGPEAQRMYAMYMQQGMPYQQAYELATGQKLMFNGGIASLF